MRTGFDILAPLYDRMERPPDAALLADDLDLSEAHQLLDVGGGTGRVSTGLHPYVRCVVVCDASLPMLRRAHRMRNLPAVQAEAEHLPFSDGAFHRVLVYDALHHFRSPEGALDEIARVLLPGGIAVFEEPDVGTRAGRLVAALEKLVGFRSTFLPVPALLNALNVRGFETEVLRRIGFRCRVRAVRRR